MEAKRDGNRVTTLIGVSSVDLSTPTLIAVNPATGAMLAEGTITPDPAGSDTQVQFNDGGVFGADAGFTYNKTSDVATIGGVLVSGLTASEIVATDGSKNLQSLAVATYPSLTELSYVKGVTSAIQTQLNAKQASITAGDTQVLFSDGANNPAGDAGLTYNKTTDTLTVPNIRGANLDGSYLTIAALGEDSGEMTGNGIEIDAAPSTTEGYGGGYVSINAGSANHASSTGSGGEITIHGGDGGATSGSGGSISLTAGSAQAGDSDGGSVNITAGSKTGAGVDGLIYFESPGSNYVFSGAGSDQTLSFINASNNRTFTFPDRSGTIATANQGADVASANNLVLGTDGDVFEITGTTQINLISNLNWANGSRITLLFTSNPTVKHNQATSTTNITIQLAGAADFVASAGDTLTLVLSEIGGTQAWREVSRAVI